MSDQTQSTFPPLDAKEAEAPYNPVKSTCEIIRGLLDVIQESGDRRELSEARSEIRKELSYIEDRVEELIETLDNREGEISDLEEHTSFGEAEFGDVKWGVKGIHHMQIMDAVGAAIQKGRPLHLLAYLESYNSDLGK